MIEYVKASFVNTIQVAESKSWLRHIVGLSIYPTNSKPLKNVFKKNVLTQGTGI